MSNYFAKTTEEVLENVQATTSGLSYREAKTRLEQNGKNALTEKKKKSNRKRENGMLIKIHISWVAFLRSQS